MARWTITNGNGEFEVSDELSALDVLLDGDIDKVMAQPRQGRRGGTVVHEADLALGEPGLELGDLRLHRATPRSGTTADLERGGAPVHATSGSPQFFIGEERVTTELLPFAIAAPTDDQRIFLASQIADEARHCVFFDRFYREVLGSGTKTIAENLAAAAPEHATTSTRSSSTASSTTAPRRCARTPPTWRRWSAGSPST